MTPVFDRTDSLLWRMGYSLGFVAAQYRINERHRAGITGYPVMTSKPLVFRRSDPAQAATLDERIDAEILQLVDVLLGATAESLRFLLGRGTHGRRFLGRRITEELAERLGVAEYLVGHPLRHFSVSLWPDDRNRMYAPNLPPAVAETQFRQLPLEIGGN